MAGAWKFPTPGRVTVWWAGMVRFRRGAMVPVWARFKDARGDVLLTGTRCPGEGGPHGSTVSVNKVNIVNFFYIDLTTSRTRGYAG